MSEETLASLSSEEGDELEWGRARRLVVTARRDSGGVELEFVSASEGENLEDRLSYLGETPDTCSDAPKDTPTGRCSCLPTRWWQDGREISFRLLRHYASSVRHQKYHGVDIVTVSVAGSS